MNETPTKELSKGERAKKQIIRQASQLFVKNGYYATGIRDIIEAAQVSKGSFYFYFSSKRDLGVAVYEYYNARLLRIFDALAETRRWPEFVDALCDWITGNAAQGSNYGCPFAAMGMETAFVDPALSQLNYEAMMQTTHAFETALGNSGISEHEASLLAERCFTLYEGYMLRYRLSKQINELERLRDALHSMI